eukprot:TRINITY_DN13562_c0_g1_i2.p1 TRINITY_DN13562_c0_g1~~TRINITY_DN13562_c0_g1_i2.p1  ORF type:complete len:193 (+),score=12.18 TRINITY_DN13562_c0_g1_i2:298-876(+)
MENQTLFEVNSKDFAVQNGFVKNNEVVRQLRQELNILEIEGRFEVQEDQQQKFRTDQVLWVSLSEIDKNQFAAAFYICKLLAAIPFEFNSKTSFRCQASELFQFCYCNQSHWVVSRDNNEQKDNGKMLSVIYFPTDHEAQLEVNGQNIIVGPDSLLILKSRKVDYGLKLTENKKLFLIRFWVCAPPHNDNNA